MAYSPPSFNHPYEELRLSGIKWNEVGEITRTSGLLVGGVGGMKTWVGFRQLIDHAKTDPLQTEATTNDHVNPHYTYFV